MSWKLIVWLLCFPPLTELNAWLITKRRDFIKEPWTKDDRLSLGFIELVVFIGVTLILVLSN